MSFAFALECQLVHFAHGGFREGWGALESPWEWLGGLEVMDEVDPRPAMVLGVLQSPTLMAPAHATMSTVCRRLG